MVESRRGRKFEHRLRAGRGRKPPRRLRLSVLWLGVFVLLAIGVLTRRLDNAPAAAQFDLQGAPSRIIDGDTFILSGERVRLRGIDAPEMDTAEGPAAREALVQLIADGPVSCRDTGQRSYERVVAVCFDAGGEDIGGAMVADGWALDLPQFSGGRYQLEEWQARLSGRGVHGFR